MLVLEEDEEGGLVADTNSKLLVHSDVFFLRNTNESKPNKSIALDRLQRFGFSWKGPYVGLRKYRKTK